MYLKYIFVLIILKPMEMTANEQSYTGSLCQPPHKFDVSIRA